jgi:uncharacterized membrane protein
MTSWGWLFIALLVLAVSVAILGPALSLIPIDTLRLIIGALLLVFGLQWLRQGNSSGQPLQAAAR